MHGSTSADLHQSLGERAPILEVKELSTHLVTRAGTIRAVDRVSFSVSAAETLGLVGESGSGKSMTCLSILRLVPKGVARIVGGEILLDGEDLLQKTESEMTQVRGKRISMILQDPMSSLNPVFTIGMQLGEAVNLAQGLRGQARDARAVELLSAVRVASPHMQLRAYPHQLSGGMRQRVVGAMAISGPPEVLIADEPTTSLDLTVQAQYLRLLKDIQKRHDLAMIFVTHDLDVVARICDRVAVMYAGRIVETASTQQLWNAPAHPYTRALLGSVPRLGASRQRLTAIEGQPPDGAAIPPGCPFHPRCPHAMPTCREQEPPAFVVDANHTSRCWLAASDPVLAPFPATPDSFQQEPLPAPHP